MNGWTDGWLDGSSNECTDELSLYECLNCRMD